MNRFNEYLNYIQIWISHLNLGDRVRLCGLHLLISSGREDRSELGNWLEEDFLSPKGGEV